MSELVKEAEIDLIVRKILIDYEDKTISDAVYKYQITENTLVLNGGEGTSGGVYELKKQ